MYPASSSSSAPFNFVSSPLVTYIPPIRYDEKGRQIDYIESAAQRQERIAFIKKREWARRVSSWIQQSRSVDEHYHRDVLYDSAMSTSKPKVTWDTISIPESPEEYYDDNEPYIIYSSSPSSPSSSTSTLSDENASPLSSPTSSKFPQRRSPRPRRRHLSLSSINEEPEEG
ncbi:hypothetical protein PILCRDRAFT_812823 [Piloderma croceum F 1598]|uniref:Uncharacterized protein n=1 Tax=Piloderma croceum (strain F 1598) TaxID=765440 RepID=A0A0C3G185_PILCF|nr:hypothetical protein PILCRDRAFT_812823 [Piloderma croceum F 1598]